MSSTISCVRWSSPALSSWRRSSAALIICFSFAALAKSQKREAAIAISCSSWVFVNRFLRRISHSRTPLRQLSSAIARLSWFWTKKRRAGSFWKRTRIKSSNPAVIIRASTPTASPYTIVAPSVGAIGGGVLSFTASAPRLTPIAAAAARSACCASWIPFCESCSEPT